MKKEERKIVGSNEIMSNFNFVKNGRKSLSLRIDFHG